MISYVLTIGQSEPAPMEDAPPWTDGRTDGWMDGWWVDRTPFFSFDSWVKSEWSLSSNLTFFELNMATKRHDSKWWRYQWWAMMMVHPGPLVSSGSHTSTIHNNLCTLTTSPIILYFVSMPHVQNMTCGSTLSTAYCSQTVVDWSFS